MTNQRKTAADYGQLSLFEETVPEWLQPEESPTHNDVVEPAAVASNLEEDDDLGQFTNWLQQSGKKNTSQ